MGQPRADASTFPFWFGSAPMSYVLGRAGPDEMFVRGEGCWLIDRTGRRFLDGRSGIGNMVLGYDRADIAGAMHKQALALPFVCTLRYERPAPVQAEYAAALVDLAPRNLTRVRFTHTGSSAVESAMLMARRYHANLGQPDRTNIVALADGFHGSTLMTMAAGGQLMLHEAFAPMPPGFHRVPLPDRSACTHCQDDAADAVVPANGVGRAGNGAVGARASSACAADLVDKVLELDSDQVAAVIVEPITGLSGIPLPGHYLRTVREFCTRNGILLIFDEVFSGLGRMGRTFAAEISGVCPDIMCLSKALTAGYAPLGAVLATDQVYRAFDEPGPYFAHGSSTDGHLVACAAGLATLQALTTEGGIRQGAEMGDRVGAALTTDLKDCQLVTGVRHYGPYIAIDTGAGADLRARMTIRRHVQAQCERRGVLIDYTPYAVLLVPPYVLPAAEAELLVETVGTVFNEFREEDVDPARLRPPSLSGRR